MSFESRILKKRLGLARKKRILLLLCTGDTCRNPMAAGYLAKLVGDLGIRDLTIRTAGVMTVNGLLPSDESLQMLEPFDVDVSGHRSSPLTPELVRQAHLILGMTPIHVQTALRLSDEAKGKTYMLRDYANTAEGKNSQIYDPMGCTLEVYKSCFKLIKKACEQVVKTPFIKELTPRKRSKPDIAEEVAPQTAKKPAAEKKAEPAKNAAQKPVKPAEAKSRKPAKEMPKTAKKKATAKKPAPPKKKAPAKKAPAKKAPTKKAPAKKQATPTSRATKKTSPKTAAKKKPTRASTSAAKKKSAKKR